MLSYILLFVNVFISVGGQYFLKYGVNSLTIPFTLYNLPRIITNPFVFSGFGLYGISSILWIYILKNVPLSIAYPTLSLGYIIVLFISYKYLNESITFYNIVGVVLIVLGVRLLFVK